MKLNKILKIILGLCILMLLFWNRLFRIRLPKDLPLQLNTMSFLLYIVVILILFLGLFISIRIFIKPGKVNDEKLFNIILNNFSYKPLKSLEEYFKSFKSVEYYLDLFQESIIESLSTDITKCLWFYLLLVIPKLIVCLAFFFEAIVMYKLNLFYKLLPLLLVSLVARYLLYVLQNRFNEQCSLMNERLVIICITPEQRNLTVDEYIHKTIVSKLGVNSIEFSCIFGISSNYVSQMTSKYVGTGTPNFDRQKALLRYSEVLQYMYSHYTLLYLIEQKRQKYDLFINVFVLSLYLISWLYILIISFHTLDPLALVKLLSWLPPSSSNPFI